MKLFYEIIHRYFRAPWGMGPRKDLVALVESGRLQPGRAIDLGSGTASNAIFLADHSFDVTGVDFAPVAIEKGRTDANAAGVEVDFFVDDLTDLRHALGTFDLLVDSGTLDDLVPNDRDLYMKNVLPLTRPGSKFVLYAHEWPLRWWEKILTRIFSFGTMSLEPGEAERRFGEHFAIERVAGEIGFSSWPPAMRCT